MPIITAETCLTQDVPPVKWAAEPLFAMGDTVLVFGRWSTFKSWIILSLGLHLAAGKPWLRYTVSKPLKVWVIDEEMGPRRTQGRVRRLMEGAGLAPDIPLVVASGEGFRAWSPRLVETFEARLRQQTFDADIIIIETLRQTMAGSEDKSEAVARFWDNLRALKKDRALIISHHTRKPQAQQRPFGKGYKTQDDDMSHEARGSGRLMDHPDVVLGVRRAAEDSIDNLVVVENLKARDAELQPPLGVEITFKGAVGPVTLLPYDLDRVCY